MKKFVRFIPWLLSIVGLLVLIVTVVFGFYLGKLEGDKKVQEIKEVNTQLSAITSNVITGYFRHNFDLFRKGHYDKTEARRVVKNIFEIVEKGIFSWQDLGFENEEEAMEELNQLIQASSITLEEIRSDLEQLRRCSLDFSTAEEVGDKIYKVIKNGTFTEEEVGIVLENLPNLVGTCKVAEARRISQFYEQGEIQEKKELLAQQNKKQGERFAQDLEEQEILLQESKEKSALLKDALIVISQNIIHRLRGGHYSDSESVEIVKKIYKAVDDGLVTWQNLGFENGYEATKELISLVPSAFPPDAAP
ncbi:MAG: hypothetical protein ABIH48_01505 [Candidatus Falkowbacteria bacterium]